MKKNFNLKAAIKAGTAAGLISGLVKLGWEDVLPPRTPERNATNPPQRLLEQLGMSPNLTHSTYTYSDQEMPWVSFYRPLRLFGLLWDHLRGVGRKTLST